jgi:hypothetical protein
MNKVLSGPILEVGQVWSFKSWDIAIIGVSKHLAEYRRCCEGKVVSRGMSDLTSIRTLQADLRGGCARLTGHLVLQDRLLQLGGSRSRTGP